MYRLALAAVVCGLAACSGDPGTPAGPGSGTAQLALLNALPAGDAATVRLDGTAMTLPAPGLSGTTLVTAGTHQLQAYSSAGQPATAVTFTIAENTHRTSVLSGSSAHYVMLIDPIDTAAAPVADGAKLRLVHTVAGAPSMDAYVFEVGHAADSSARFLTPFVFGSGTDPQFPGFAVRPAGQYDVWLKASGTDNVLVQFGPITVNNGDVYSFVLSENAQGAMEIRAVKGQ